MNPPDRARLTIDLDALAHNYGALKADAHGAEVAPVVKSDGYGLGAAQVSRRLWAEGARSFFVARLAEGEALRAALGPERPAEIYVLDGLLAGAAERLAAAELTPVLSTSEQVAAAGGPIALHVDTGMNRQGLTLAELASVPRPSDVRLLMSHLGSASEPDEPRNAAQLGRFREACALFPAARTSLSASAGLYLGADYRCDMVRPGVALYGGGPLERPDDRFRAVATLTAPVLDVRQLAAGDRVGYGEAFTATASIRVAVVAAGYADGIIRAAKGAGYAWAAGARRRLLVVNMDMLVIDIGDANLAAGDPVELLGPHALLDDLAAAAGTVAHEILVRLSLRAERIYLGKA
jgi:alanine racemase